MMALCGVLATQQALAQTREPPAAPLPTPAPQAPPAAPPGAPSTDVEALVRQVQEQIDRMNAAAVDRDKALQFLEQQIDAATGALSSTGETAESLRARAAALDSQVESLESDREALNQKLAAIEDERDRRIRELEQRLARLDEVLGGTRSQTAALEGQLGDVRGELDASRARVASLERSLVERDQQVGELQTALAEREERLEASAADVARLSGQLTGVSQQLGTVMTLLGRSEGTVRNQQVKIDELGVRLNQALAERVEELAQYRSEFFGRLRQVLGDRQDIRIVGDRFVLPSELLFGSGSAQLDAAGQDELGKLAGTLRDVAATIPPDIDWVLRVDGHTDRQPVRGDGRFRSNWELSTARAIAVVEFLIQEGIAPARLAATGFGEWQPIDPAEGEPAYARNRRIEFKLTEG